MLTCIQNTGHTMETALVHILGSTYKAVHRAPLICVQRFAASIKSARRARSLTTADRCGRVVRGRSSKSRAANARAKSAAGVQQPPVDGPVADQLEVKKTAVSVRRHPK